jgi:hypothetical protein
MEPELLYRQLGRLLETMPAFPTRSPLRPDHHQWLGRANALMKQTGDTRDFMDMSVAMGLMVAHRDAALEQMKIALYRALAVAELNAPASAKGAFIPVGSSFDAFAALAKVFESATTDVFIVDPYMDEAALTEFGGIVPAGATLRLLADQEGHKSTLQSAVMKWVAQYGTARPLAVRLAPSRILHDRAIFIDGKTAWTLTQSLKDFAKRSPAEIVRADDTAALKIAAYESIWNSATVIV